MFGHDEIKKLIAFQEEIVAEVAVKKKWKLHFMKLMLKLMQKFVTIASRTCIEAIQVQEKHARQDAIDEVKNEAVAHIMKKKKQMTIQLNK